MRLRWTFLSTAALLYIVQSPDIAPDSFADVLEKYQKANERLKGVLAVLIGASVTAAVAWIALKTNASVNIRNKRMDIILHCNNRYDDLYKLRHEIDKETSDPVKSGLIKSYFRRYWGLQSDQIDYWLAGYVDPETMTSWVVSLVASLKEKAIGDGVNRKTYAESWKNDASEAHRVVNERLIETVSFARDELSRITDPASRYAAALQYLRIIEANERSLIRHLSRDSHRRMRVDDLATTILPLYWQQYNRLDIRSFPFRWLYRMQAAAGRTLAVIPDALQANRLDRLRTMLLPTVTAAKQEAPEAPKAPEADVSS